MLHVDAKGDTYIDATNTLNIADDVVFTAEGRIGVGTVTPQTRLDIRGSLRMADGTEGAGKVLVSDANGVARWEPMLGSWYAALRGGSTTHNNIPYTYTSAELSPPGTGSVDPAAGTVTVPHTGMYTLTLTGRCNPSGTSANYSHSMSYVHVMINNAARTFFAQQEPRALSEDMDFGYILILPLSRNDVVKLIPNVGDYHAHIYSDVTIRLDFMK
jgi:hypothetical protein